jgi:hypothetical protein
MREPVTNNHSLFSALFANFLLEEENLAIFNYFYNCLM